MSRFRVLAAGIVVGAVALLATAAPASAHDELLSSTPAAGDRLDTAPTEVSLTFSADVLDVGAAIIVADAGGIDWTAGDPVLDGGAVTVPLEAGMDTGGYEVRWRVVSSDGHPISGVIPFTVGDADPLQRDTSTTETDAAGDAPASDTPTTAEGDGAGRLVLLGGAGAAIAVAVFAAIHFLRRRRVAAGGADAPRDAASDES